MATIKGKWQFTNDAMRIKDHPVHYCEQAVNFTAATTTPCTSITFDYSEANQTVNILFYLPEVVMHHFIVNPSTGGITDAAYAQVDFGNTPQEVSGEFLDLMNLVAVPTEDDWTVTLNGKYVVSLVGVGKIFTDYDLNIDYMGPPRWKNVNYTDMKGRSFNYIAYYGPGPYAGSIYFGTDTDGADYNKSCDKDGFDSDADGCQIIDFGQTNQTIDAIFYGEVLRYALVPFGNELVDTAGVHRMIVNSKHRSDDQILDSANKSLAKTYTFLAYNASSTRTSYGAFNSQNVDELLLCVTPSNSSTQIFLAVPIKNLAKGASMNISAPDNTRSTGFSISRNANGYITITANACFNDSATSLGTSYYGYIRAIYGLKIGG